MVYVAHLPVADALGVRATSGPDRGRADGMRHRHPRRSPRGHHGDRGRQLVAGHAPYRWLGCRDPGSPLTRAHRSRALVPQYGHGSDELAPQGLTGGSWRETGRSAGSLRHEPAKPCCGWITWATASGRRRRLWLNALSEASVAIRYIQVRRDDLCSKRSKACHARRYVSCTRSSASPTEPVIR